MRDARDAYESVGGNEAAAAAVASPDPKLTAGGADKASAKGAVGVDGMERLGFKSVVEEEFMTILETKAGDVERAQMVYCNSFKRFVHSFTQRKRF